MNALNGSIERRDQRFSVFVAAMLSTGASSVPVTVRNLSRFGATLHVSTSPPVGSEVTVVRGKFRGKARVVWTLARRVGLCFSHPIYVDDWIAPPGNPAQQLADQIFSHQNLAGGAPKGRALIDYPEPFARDDQQISDAIALLAELEEKLSKDSIVVSQHGLALQNLDLALQILRRLA
jgi:PilZ domain